MKKCLFILTLLVISFNIFALPSQYIIPLSSDVYDNIDMLYALDGKVTPSTTRPWSINEANNILNQIDFNNLNKNAFDLYNKVKEEINVSSLRFDFDDNASFNIGLDVAIEMYVHSDDGTNVKTENDWFHDADERLPFLKSQIELAIGNFYTYCDIQYGMSRMYTSENDVYLNDGYPDGVGAIVKPGKYCKPIYVDQFGKHFAINVPLKSKYFDFNWPKRAILSLGGKQWNLNFSRDKINWGRSIIGNFIVDNHVDYNDYLSFKTFSKNINYNVLAIFFDTQTSAGENQELYNRMLLAHQIELKLFDKFLISFNEDVMYYSPILSLKYLNPSFIYHNLNNRSMLNALLNVNMNWVIAPKIELYLQIAVDQWKVANENNAQSNAFGVEFGIKDTYQIKNLFCTTTLEGAYVTPCMYRRDYVDFIIYQKYFSISKSYVLDFDYIGFPYGGDSLVFKLEQKMIHSSLGKITISDTLLLKGEITMFESVSLTDNGYSNYGDDAFKNGIKTVKNVFDIKIEGNPFKINTMKSYLTVAFINQKAIDDSYLSYNDIQITLGFQKGI